MDHPNKVRKFARKALRSEAARADPNLANDISMLIEGKCVYLEGFNCGRDDLAIMQRLAEELETSSSYEAETTGQEKAAVVAWSQHTKIENPGFSPTFNFVVDKLAAYFSVDVYATRLNYYRDGADWKPFHKDSHAYHNGNKEDFTFGASFGAERQLAFQHDSSGISFSFPQKNGDVFAFDSDVNRVFKHGVPKLGKQGSCGPRFSIIAWGRRRVMSSRNGGSGAAAGEQGRGGAVVAENVTRAPTAGAREHQAQQQRTSDRSNDGVMSGSDMLATITEHVAGSARAAMRSEARKIKQELGRRAYKNLRKVSRAVQLKEISVQEYVREAVQIVGGDKRPLFAMLSFLPDKALGVEIRNELMCCA